MAKRGKQHAKISGTWEQIKPSYNDLVDVPDDFNPSTHEHDIDEINGLIEGTAFSGTYSPIFYIGADNRLFTNSGGINFTGSTNTLEVTGDVTIGGNSVATQSWVNSQGFLTSETGDIQGVTAGDGLSGGGTSGTVTVSHADTSSQASLTALTGANVVSDIDLDTYGHVTNLSTRALTASDISALSTSGGTISGNLSVTGTITSNGLTVSNDNIVGVNQLSINDPGEGILWQGTTNVNQIIIDDANDNIMDFQNLAEMRVGGTKVLVSNGVDNGTTWTGATVPDRIFTSGGQVTLIRTKTLTLGDLGYTGDTNANNYVHPTYNGDDFSVDSGALTGATVISDIDINVTTDTSGHVTDANGTIATRNLTLADLGFTGASNADNYVGWDLYTNGTYRALINSYENVNFATGAGLSLSYSSTNNTLTFESTASGGESEWEYVTLVENATGAALSHTATDRTTYDYKYVLDIQTSAEDTSSTYIRFNNNDSANEYSYQYQRIQQTAETTEVETLAGDAYTSLIYMGSSLSSYSNGGSNVSTVMNGEFIVSVNEQSYYPGIYTATVNGWSSHHYQSASGTVRYDGMSHGSFTGSKSNLYLSEKDNIIVTHSLSAGTTDVCKMLVYRRAKH